MARPIQVTVLGAGSWGTTVAALAAKNADALLWARAPEVADEINRDHTHSRYLQGLELPAELKATADLHEAVAHADVLVLGVPSHVLRATLTQVAPLVRPWIPILSLVKGLEQGTLLRAT